MARRPELLARTRVVLHHPFFPENIGSVARAMFNMGLFDLRTVEGVSPRHPNAHKLAVGAGALLEAASECPDLETALGGATLVFATTSRVSSHHRVMTPREAADLAAGHTGPVAIVIGNEKNGLTREQLYACHGVIRIPCLQPQASLNLAQAALIVCYAWLEAGLAEGTPAPLVGAAAVLGEADHAELASRLDAALVTAGFFKAHNRAQRLSVARRILGRLRLDAEEAAFLRMVANKLLWLFTARGGAGGEAPQASRGGVSRGR